MHLISGSVAKFLPFAFATNEGFEARNARDYPPASVKNSRDPSYRNLLGGEHSSEKIIWDADDHLEGRLSKPVADGDINEHHPAVPPTLMRSPAAVAPPHQG